MSDMDNSCISCGEVVFGNLHVLQSDGCDLIFASLSLPLFININIFTCI